jgi:hypothetical protein
MYQNRINPAIRGFIPVTRLAIVAVLFSLAYLLPSCEEPSFIGLEIQPGDDRFRVRTAEEISVSSSLLLRDSIPAIIQPRSLLGVLNDPLFGQTKASFLTQTGIQGDVNFGNNPVAQALVLYLHYTDVYGDPQIPQEFRVYELNQIIDHEFPYHSNLDVTEMISGQPPLAVQTVTRAAGDTLITLNLDHSELGNRLLNAPDTVMRSVSAFIGWFKGLYVTAQQTEGTGAVYGVNLNSLNSRMTLYFRNDDHPDSTLRFHYIINERANRVNLFEHDHSEAVFHAQLGQTTPDDDLFYVQGGSGVMSRLDFDDLHQWRDSMPVTINSARLYLPVAENMTGSGTFTLPPRLAIFEKDADGQFRGIMDTALGDNYFGGTYNEETGEYQFNISRWTQGYILEQGKSNSIYIAVRNAAIIPHRAVLRGQNHPPGGPRLEITYTRH